MTQIGKIKFWPSTGSHLGDSLLRDRRKSPPRDLRVLLNAKIAVLTEQIRQAGYLGEIAEWERLYPGYDTVPAGSVETILLLARVSELLNLRDVFDGLK